jgi:ATP-dependent DNA ligase
MRLPLSFILVSQSSGRGWVHELKHDGYRLQVRDE